MKTRGPSYDIKAIMEEVCRRISEGETLPKICADKSMPKAQTVRAWCLTNPAHAEMMLAARLEQAFSWVDQAIDIADDAHLVANGPDGHAQLAAQKLRVDTRIRLMGKVNPRLSEASRATIETQSDEIPAVTPEALKAITACANAVRESLNVPPTLRKL